MFNYTDQEYIYYSYNNIYYRIPTYNKILKIIDWGRSTYNFNNFKGNNSIFNSDGDAFLQHAYPRINKTGKQTVYPNFSSDLAIFASDILKLDNFPKKGRLYNLVKTWIEQIECALSNSGFQLYIDIAKNCTKSIPLNQITAEVFKKFIYNNEDIPEDSIIYYID